MADKRGRPKQTPEVRCHRHPGSTVQSMGTYEAASGRRRKYRCIPTGDEKHYFSPAPPGRAEAAPGPPVHAQRGERLSVLP